MQTAGCKELYNAQRLRRKRTERIRARQMAQHTFRAREKSLRRPLLFCFFCFLGIVAKAQNDSSCKVNSTSSILAALADSACSIIVITGRGFKMDQAEAAFLLADQQEHRVRLYRSIVIRGEQPPTLWDLAFLKRRIGIEEYNAVTLEGLFVPNGRQPSGISYGNLDIFAMGDYSQLILRDVVLVYPLCMPLSIASEYTPSVPRPLGFSGTQSSRPTGPVCFPDVDFLPTCWDESMLLEDFVIIGGTIDSSGIRRSTGVILEYNTTYVCEHTISEACIRAKNGSFYCIQQALEKYHLGYWELYDLFLYPPSPPFPPAPPPSPPLPPWPPLPPRLPHPTPTPPIMLPVQQPTMLTGQQQNGSAPLLAIVLPSVFGGLALLAAFFGGVAFWWRRRRRRRNSSEVKRDIQPTGLTKTSKGTTRGSIGERYSLRLDPIPNTQGILLPLATSGAAEAVGGNSASGSTPWFARTPANGIWAASADGVNPIWRTNGDAEGVNPIWRTNGDADGVNPIWRANGDGGGAAVVAARSTITSSVQSGCSAVGLQSNGATAVESMLGNPLLAAKGNGCGSGSSSIALNMVLGVDVFASREAVIGRGTFATVLEGQLGGRPVAVKLFHRDALGGTANDVKSLKQEIAILARCQHPNVVALLGAGSTTAGDEVFLVEELMVNNLARACHEGEGLSLHRVLSVARDVATGLAYLHPTVIHRDLKPANVLLDQCGNAKLTDFGLSRLWASTVHTANPEAGTVQYMAPECFSGSLSNDAPEKTPISHQSDIYSFGVLVWEMLARERPWKGLSSIQVALAVGFQQQRLKIPEGDTERFHPKLRKLILQCWETDPRKRPGAAEIAKRLSLLLQHLEMYGSMIASGTSAAATVSFASSACSDLAGGCGSSSMAAPPISNGSLPQGHGGTLNGTEPGS